jgi:hypothetical protein
MVDATVWRQVKYEARESLVRFLEYPSTRRGSGGSQKPFSWLSEGVRGVFTISTDLSETACIPHLHILGAPMSTWTLVRADILQELLLVTFVVTVGRR